jgi:hypothetical protein
MDKRDSAAVPGTLYVVATPIGNLEDITLRALAVLRSVDLVAAEDTRKTAQLLRHFDISAPLLSYYDHNETVRAPELVDRLRNGAAIALVTTAGTPCISDPGYRVVAAAAAAGLRVVPVPGPSRSSSKGFCPRSRASGPPGSRRLPPTPELSYYTSRRSASSRWSRACCRCSATAPRCWPGS